MAEPRWCYFVCPTSFIEGRGFIPSIVTEGVAGHSPLIGNSGQDPWFWGMTLEEAEGIARDKNEILELTENDVNEIIGSSFRAGLVDSVKLRNSRRRYAEVQYEAEQKVLEDD